MLLRGNRLCVLDVDNLRGQVLDEAHGMPYAMHLRATKMYNDVKRSFWWHGIKRDFAKYVGRCMSCQQVKKHQRPGGVL